MLLLLALAQAASAQTAATASDDAAPTAQTPQSSALDAELFYQLLLGELDAGGRRARGGLLADPGRGPQDQRPGAVPAGGRHRVPGPLGRRGAAGGTRLETGLSAVARGQPVRLADPHRAQPRRGERRAAEGRTRTGRSQGSQRDPGRDPAQLFARQRQEAGRDRGGTGPGRIPGPAGDRLRGLDRCGAHAAGGGRQGRRPRSRAIAPRPSAPPAKVRPCWRWS